MKSLMKTLQMKYLLLPAFVLLLFGTNACDQGFQELNTDPTSATQLNPGVQFTDVQLRAAEDRYESWRGNLIYCETMIQHLSSTITAWAGDRYTLNYAYDAAFWDAMYPNAVKQIQDVINTVKDNPDQVNMYAEARIMRVFIFHRITDLYGDIPYSEAGKGYITGNVKPKYDSQESIYKDMIKELNESISALDASKKTFGKQDIIYGGDVTKWKKFANSLKLRLGMRLTKVDPALAQKTVEEAANSGVMTSNDDIAYIRQANGPAGIDKYGVGQVFNDFGIGGHGFRMSDNFVDLLVDRDNNFNNIDPRAKIFAAVYDDQGNLVSDDPHDFKGFPNGLTSEEIGQLDTYSYAQPNRDYMVRYDSPNLFLTYAEVEFNLAEAAQRGWNVSGTAQSHYEAGIRAAMKQMTLYGAPEISDSAINDYISKAPAADMQQINVQKYIALFLNGYEAYANWRRTGYPNLTPVDYPGNRTNGTIPRRLVYPLSEQSSNSANYEDALNRQGPDEFTTRMWWDKK